MESPPSTPRKDTLHRPSTPLPKPKFSLSSVRENNPALRDHFDLDPVAFQDRISAEEECHVPVPPSPVKSDVSQSSAMSRLSTPGLEKLDELFEAEGIYLDTTEGYDELIYRIQNPMPRDQLQSENPISVDPDDPFVSSSDDNPGADHGSLHWREASVSSADSVQTVKPAKTVLSKASNTPPGSPLDNKGSSAAHSSVNASPSKSTPSVSPMDSIPSDEPGIDLEAALSTGSTSNLYALSKTLSAIDTFLDELEGRPSGPRLIEPPHILNPLATSFGTMFIRCNNGTCYKVHKALLWIHSARQYAHSRANPQKMLYELDTDETTLGIFVKWLYGHYQKVRSENARARVKEMKEQVKRRERLARKLEQMEKKGKGDNVSDDPSPCSSETTSSQALVLHASAEENGILEQMKKYDEQEEAVEEVEVDAEVLDLARYPTDQLCELITVCLMIRVPGLYNSIANVLLKRHYHPRTPTLLLGSDDQQHMPTMFTFNPGKDILRRIYRESREFSPLRKMVGFLLLKSGWDDTGPVVGWELEMTRDVEYWAERIRTQDWNSVNMEEFKADCGDGKGEGIRRPL